MPEAILTVDRRFRVMKLRFWSAARQPSIGIRCYLYYNSDISPGLLKEEH